MEKYDDETSKFDDIKKSVDFGKNIDLKNQFNETCLTLASFHGYKNIVEYLIEKNVDLDKYNAEGNNALMISIIEKEYGISKILLQTDINIDTYNNDGENALILACQKDNDEIIKLIINKIPEINHTDHEGYNSLFYSVLNNNFEIVKLLIDNNIDLSHVDEYERSVLDVLFDEKNIEKYNVDMIKTLEEEGVQFDFDKVDDININIVGEIFPEKYKKYMMSKKSSDFNL